MLHHPGFNGERQRNAAIRPVFPDLTQLTDGRRHCSFLTVAHRGNTGPKEVLKPWAPEPDLGFATTSFYQVWRHNAVYLTLSTDPNGPLPSDDSDDYHHKPYCLLWGFKKSYL